MEYGRLQPLKGSSAYESTAITKKSIKELLAEEGADAEEAYLKREPAEAPVAAEAPAIQEPPHAKTKSPEAAKAAFVPLAEPEAPPAEKRSLLGRLLGR